MNQTCPYVTRTWRCRRIATGLLARAGWRVFSGWIGWRRDASSSLRPTQRWTAMPRVRKMAERTYLDCCVILNVYATRRFEEILEANSAMAETSFVVTDRVEQEALYVRGG